MTRHIATSLFFVLLVAATTGCMVDEDPNSNSNTNQNSNTNPAPYCAPEAGWTAAWESWEQQMLDLYNGARAAGADCGSNGYYGPAGPLVMDPLLRCASRMHSKDMHDRNFFDHTNPDGDGPVDRFQEAGWSGSGWGENIIAGYGSPEAAFDGWMSSDGHCANIMDPDFNRVGIGFYEGSSGYGDYATAGFGIQ